MCDFFATCGGSTFFFLPIKYLISSCVDVYLLHPLFYVFSCPISSNLPCVLWLSNEFPTLPLMKLLLPLCLAALFLIVFNTLLLRLLSTFACLSSFACPLGACLGGLCMILQVPRRRRLVFPLNAPRGRSPRRRSVGRGLQRARVEGAPRGNYPGARAHARPQLHSLRHQGARAAPTLPSAFDFYFRYLLASFILSIPIIFVVVRSVFLFFFFSFVSLFPHTCVICCLPSSFDRRLLQVENIMLDARGHVKLIDFGLSQEISQEEEPMSPIGSLIYMAPELLTKSMGGRHTDWYNENEWCWKK